MILLEDLEKTMNMSELEAMLLLDDTGQVLVHGGGVSPAAGAASGRLQLLANDDLASYSPNGTRLAMGFIYEGGGITKAIVSSPE